MLGPFCTRTGVTLGTDSTPPSAWSVTGSTRPRWAGTASRCWAGRRLRVPARSGQILPYGIRVGAAMLVDDLRTGLPRRDERFDLIDVQWAVLEPLLPAPKGPGRLSLWSRRQLIDGIRWRIRVGAPWRDVPPQYGSWSAMYALFRRWQRDETWKKVLTALQALADAAGGITGDASVDSASARAHQHAAGARKRGICRQNHPATSSR